MTLKPDPNLINEKREISPAHSEPGGDRIVVYGDVGPGSVVGRGSVQADNIVGSDLTINGNVTETYTQFADLLTELNSLIEEAKKAGELDEKRAVEVKERLESTSEIIKEEKKPPKSKIMERLQYVTDVIDAAVDTFNDASGPAKWLLRALPIAALLVKLAARIF